MDDEVTRILTIDGGDPKAAASCRRWCTTSCANRRPLAGRLLRQPLGLPSASNRDFKPADHTRCIANVPANVCPFAAFVLNVPFNSVPRALILPVPVPEASPA